MIAFQPKGPVNSFTAASTAPTAVQSLTSSGQLQQYVCVNTDSAVDVVLGWGQSSDEAVANAASSTSEKQFYLQHGTTQVITMIENAYITGKTASSTAVVKVQCGYGN